MTSSPRISRTPSSGERTQPRIDSSVVLPLPEGPTRNRHSPRGIVRSMSLQHGGGDGPVAIGFVEAGGPDDDVFHDRALSSLQNDRRIDPPNPKKRQQRRRQADHETRTRPPAPRGAAEFRPAPAATTRIAGSPARSRFPPANRPAAIASDCSKNHAADMPVFGPQRLERRKVARHGRAPARTGSGRPSSIPPAAPGRSMRRN